MKPIYNALLLLFFALPLALQAQTADFTCKDGQAVIAMEQAAAARKLQFRSSPFTDNYDVKYGHAQFGWGGGMEHQTMSFMGGFSHLLQAHELAHQWFGNKVTCGSWQDIWLNEGFATYLEGLTYNYGLGPNTFPNWLAGKITHVTSDPGGSVFVTDTSSVGRIFSSRLSYSKGGVAAAHAALEAGRRRLLPERPQLCGRPRARLWLC